MAVFQFDGGGACIIDESSARAVLLPPSLLGEIVSCDVWTLVEALEWSQAARRLGLTIDESIELWERKNVNER